MEYPLLNEFILEECSDLTRKFLLDEITKGKANPIGEKRAIEFNIFNVDIDFVQHLIMIEDDIDGRAITIPLEAFCHILVSKLPFGSEPT